MVLKLCLAGDANDLVAVFTCGIPAVVTSVIYFMFEKWKHRNYITYPVLTRGFNFFLFWVYPGPYACCRQLLQKVSTAPPLSNENLLDPSSLTVAAPAGTSSGTFNPKLSRAFCPVFDCRKVLMLFLVVVWIVGARFLLRTYGATNSEHNVRR